jgi:hypothetical protein
VDHLHAVHHVGLVRRLVRDGFRLGDAVLQFSEVLRSKQLLDLVRVDQLEQFRTHGVGRRGCRSIGFLGVGARHQDRRSVQAEGSQQQAKASEAELGHE